MKTILKGILITIMLFTINVHAAYNESNIGTYEEELNRFPDYLKSKIEELHTIYPNAIFVNQDLFYDWKEKKEIGVDFNRMRDSEYTTNGRSLIYYTYPDGYKSTDSWAYSFYTNKYETFSGSSWHVASLDTIAYYLDSRNFLNEKNVFMFESLLFHDYQTVEGIEKILKGTFMGDRYCGGSTKKYSEVIMEAARENDVSPYMLASRLRLEQGVKGTSSLISGTYPGYEGYYNYFNIEAAGKTDHDVIINGLEKAKTAGWDSPEKSIKAGAAFIKNRYVGINDSVNAKGQLTLYLQKWDPYGNVLGGHQYMQNITAPVTESESTYNSYAAFDGYKDYRYIFYIPIYTNMPDKTKLPNKGNPNNWLSKLTVNGANVSGFDSAKTDYSINVLSSTSSVNVDYVKVANTSSVTGAGVINLDGNKTIVNLDVKAENGNIRTYTLTINRQNSENIENNDIIDNNEENNESNNSNENNNNESKVYYVAVSEIINGAGIKTDGTYLSGIELGTKTSDLKDKITSVTSGVSVSITDINGNELDGTLATGNKVTVTSGEEVKEYYIVLYGDVNGDGSIKASDYVFIKNYIMGSKQLSDAYLKAADVNKDGKVKASDYVLIKNNIMGSYKIEQ